MELVIVMDWIYNTAYKYTNNPSVNHSIGRLYARVASFLTDQRFSAIPSENPE